MLRFAVEPTFRRAGRAAYCLLKNAAQKSRPRAPLDFGDTVPERAAALNRLQPFSNGPDADPPQKHRHSLVSDFGAVERAHVKPHEAGVFDAVGLGGGVGEDNSFGDVGGGIALDLVVGSREGVDGVGIGL